MNDLRNNGDQSLMDCAVREQEYAKVVIPKCKVCSAQMQFVLDFYGIVYLKCNQCHVVEPIDKEVVFPQTK